MLKVIKPIIVICAVALLLFAWVRVVFTDSQTVINEDELLRVVNEWRASVGKEEYQVDPVVCGYAHFRVKQIQSDWSHDGMPAAAAGIREHSAFTAMGENLSDDTQTEKNTLEMWLNSPSHRETLDKDYTHTCIRCENSYCVQLFAK